MKKIVIMLLFCLVQSFTYAQNSVVNNKLDSLGSLSIKYNRAMEKFNTIVLKIRNSGAYCPDSYQSEPRGRKLPNYKAMLAVHSDTVFLNRQKIWTL